LPFEPGRVRRLHTYCQLEEGGEKEGEGTNHAGCDTADAGVDFVDGCDAIGVKEFVWDFLLADYYGG